METVRAYKLEKYTEFSVNDSCVKDKFKFDDSFNEYVIVLDLSMDANMFYGVKENDKFEIVHDIVNFDNYDCICRLLNWNRDKNKETFVFRCLKSNKNEIVDFKEEKEYLKTRLV